MAPERTHIYVTIPIRNESSELASNVQCLVDQEGIEYQDYSLLYLISNTKNETATNSPVYKDNIQSLNLLRNFQKVLDPRLTLQILDFTGISKAPDADSVGLARRSLVEEVTRIHNNYGLDSAIVATLDADTWVNKDYISKLKGAFSNTRVSVVVGSINYRGTDDIPYLEYLYFRIYDTAAALLKAEPQVSAQSLAFRLDAYQHVGGFKAISGGEDIDLGRRLIESEGVIFTDDIVTYPKLRYSDRCAGNGKLLFEIHQSLMQGKPVNFLMEEEVLSTEQLIARALVGVDFGSDDLSLLVDDIIRKMKKPSLTFQEINLLFKYRMLRMVERRLQNYPNSSSNNNPT
ncbi:MAG: glycosyltransferase [Candidatus Daviesbacteria bacterium]